MDYYQILDLSKTATKEEIQKKYRKLAMQYHPDRNPGDKEAEDKFKELQLAYETLNDPIKRRNYDHYGQGNFNQNPFSTSYDDLFDFFQSRNQPKEYVAHGDHIVIQLKIDLEAVLKGSEIDLEFKKKDLCSVCEGEGGVKESCKICNGQGWHVIKGPNVQVKKACTSCEGKRWNITSVCKACRGSCYTEPKPDRLEAALPAGVENGQQIIFKARGNPGKKGGRPGNLIVEITIENHILFKRALKGDLYCDVPVTYNQLVLGDEVELPVLDGKKIAFRIPAGTQSGSKLRLKKQGVPKFCTDSTNLKPDDYGDLIVELKLETPINLTNEQVALVEMMAKHDEQLEHYPLRKEFKKVTERLKNG